MTKKNKQPEIEQGVRNRTDLGLPYREGDCMKEDELKIVVETGGRLKNSITIFQVQYKRTNKQNKKKRVGERGQKG